jgi:NADPH:quinone reductase-like Zn-dependent oxidoreductase
MHAVYFERHGGPEVLIYGKQPRPVPTADQVLIEVHAASLNPRDWMLREGTYPGGILVRARPVIPGSDVSGVVVEVGSKVDGFAVGDAVVALQSTFGNMGGYAEFCAVKAACVAHKPAEVSHVDAAGVPCAGLTAWQSLFDIARTGAGSLVTIVGSAGGVGHYAMQLARWAGAEITAVCGPANQDYARELGAAQVIDYRAEDFTGVVRNQDVVFDTVGRSGHGAVRGTLASGGVHITTMPTPLLMGQSLASRAIGGGRRLAVVTVMPRQRDLTSMLQLMAAGEIRSEIAQVFPLAEAAEAQTLSREFHTRGKLVLSVRD